MHTRQGGIATQSCAIATRRLDIVHAAVSHRIGPSYAAPTHSSLFRADDASEPTMLKPRLDRLTLPSPWDCIRTRPCRALRDRRANAIPLMEVTTVEISNRHPPKRKVAVRQTYDAPP
jgi:hypothetical protein